MGCNSPLYIQSSDTDTDLSTTSPNIKSLAESTPYTACILRLGLRAYGPWLRCRVTTCRILQHWIRVPISLLHSTESAMFRILQNPDFPHGAKYTPYHFCNIPAEEIGVMDPRCSVIDRAECIQATAGPWPYRLSLIAEACRAQSRYSDRVRKLRACGGKYSLRVWRFIKDRQDKVDASRRREEDKRSWQR